MARWHRAVAMLPLRQGKILDLGCFIGIVTKMLSDRGYEAVGVDHTAQFICWAQERHPAGKYILSPAETLPFPAATFDAIIFLDVLEHVVDQAAVICEIQRVLKPGGTLILSVPHRGILACLDSLNLHSRLVRATHHGQFPQEIAQTGVHRHYSAEELCMLLGPTFTLQRTIYTGLGLAELVNLSLLLLCRYIFAAEKLYARLLFLYLLAYLIEDTLPLGRLSYHLMTVFQKE